jgi:hypothetical protein
VSPWRVGSQDDVARSVNWFLLAKRFEDMPPSFEVSSRFSEVLMKWPKFIRKMGAKNMWRLESHDFPGDLRDALREYEIRAETKREEIRGLEESRGSKKRGKSHHGEKKQQAQRLQRLKDDVSTAELNAFEANTLSKRIDEATSIWRMVLRCPVCNSEDPDQERRDEGFWCVCTGCQAEWGTQRCGSCGGVKPCIRPYSKVWRTALRDGKDPVAIAGSDLLASPLLDASENVAFRCPTCGEAE